MRRLFIFLPAAYIELIYMLEPLKAGGFADIEGIKTETLERARVIEGCKSSLESVFRAHADRDNQVIRKREYKQNEANFAAQERILRFFIESTCGKCLRVCSRFDPAITSNLKETDPEITLSCMTKADAIKESFQGELRCCINVTSNMKETDPEITLKMKESFQRELRCWINVTKSIAGLLLDIVGETLNSVDGQWQESLFIEGKSVINAKYYCKVRLVLIKSETPTALVYYEINGDGSEGDLQDPSASRLYVDDVPQKQVEDTRTFDWGDRIKASTGRSSCFVCTRMFQRS